MQLYPTDEKVIDQIMGIIHTLSKTKYHTNNDGQYRRRDKPFSQREKMCLYAYGEIKWFYNCLGHRFGDELAIIRPDGFNAWYDYGVLHRDDGPAVIYPDGTLGLYKDGQKYVPQMKKL